MEMKITRENETLVISATGRLDGVNAPTFENTLKTEIGEEDRAVIVDFENLTYICSLGLRHILAKAKELWERDGTLIVCSLSASVREIFEIINFHKIVPIYASRTEALNSLDN